MEKLLQIQQSRAALITPDVYKLNIYKFGLCTADPDLNDLTSCQMFFESAAGIELDIQLGVSANAANCRILY